jgi:hypothetical protein
MYAFRKPFAAASYAGAPLFGRKLKTAFVLSQIIGYTCSKYLALKVVSEASRARRWPMLIGTILVAEPSTRFMPGLLLLLLVYLRRTAFRDFRDNYGVEIFAGLGYSSQPALFTATEVPVAVLVLVTLAALGLPKDPVKGLAALFALMLAGLLLLAAATFLLEHALLSGAAWMILIGFGAYLAYVPFSSFLFDRVTVATRFAGTAVFAINLADATGYTGSVALQLYKDVFAGGMSHLGFFITVTYALAAFGSAGLALSAWYFLRAARAPSLGVPTPSQS